MHVICLAHVAIAAVDYPSSNLICYSGETAKSSFCCNGKSTPNCTQFFSEAIFCCNSKKFSSEFRIHLTGREGGREGREALVHSYE